MAGGFDAQNTMASSIRRQDIRSKAESLDVGWEW